MMSQLNPSPHSQKKNIISFKISFNIILALLPTAAEIAPKNNLLKFRKNLLSLLCVLLALLYRYMLLLCSSAHSLDHKTLCVLSFPSNGPSPGRKKRFTRTGTRYARMSELFYVKTLIILNINLLKPSSYLLCHQFLTFKHSAW